MTPSESPVRFTGFNYPAPVSNVEKAYDLKINESNDGSGINVRIDHPNGGRSFDIESGHDRMGLPLIYYPTNNTQAQRFRLIMLADNSFVIGYKDKCLKYDESKSAFVLGSCSDLKDSTFDLYYEVKPEKEYKEEQTYNLKGTRIPMASPKDYDYNKGTNPATSENKDKNVTEVIFKDGKVLTRAELGKDIGMQFAHSEVKLKPETREITAYKKGPKSRKRTESLIGKGKKCSAKKILSSLCDMEDSESSSSDSESNSDRHHRVGRKTHLRRHRRSLTKPKHGAFV